MVMKKKTIKKLAPKSEFFDLDLVLENATLLQDGYFESSTLLSKGDKTIIEAVSSKNGVTTFSHFVNGKATKYYRYQNGKWS